jgi:hypothetical protein
MNRHADAILALIRRSPGLNDDEISKELGIFPRQTVNAACRALQVQTVVSRAIGGTGKMSNFPTTTVGLAGTHPKGRSGPTPTRLMARIDFKARRKALTDQCDAALSRFNARETFTGPSLHYHLASLEASENGDIDRFIDMVYALLPSWGMHRMGRRGPKMVEFDAFRKSILAVENDLRSLREKTPLTIRREDWMSLERAFRGVYCMRTNVKLIGNSKVLAHWLPNLVPPIDREYTLAFIPYTGDISGIGKGWEMMEILLREFFYPILVDAEFCSFAERTLARSKPGAWHTSSLKLVDNLLIGANKKARKRPQSSV